MKSLIAYLLILMMGIDSPANLNNASNSNIIMKDNNLGIYSDRMSSPCDYPYYTFTFLDGVQKIIDVDNSETVLMINGSIYPNIILESKNNEFYIKLKDVKNELGLNISKLFKDNMIIINDDLYISLDVLCIDTDSKIGYTDSMFFPINVITIDQKTNKPYISSYEAYDLLMENFSHTLTDCETKFINTYLDDPDLDWDYYDCFDRYLDFYPAFKAYITNIEYNFSTSKYYIFCGYYCDIFVDKYTKDIYFGITDIDQYIIKKVDFNDMYAISSMYLFN